MSCRSLSGCSDWPGASGAPRDDGLCSLQLDGGCDVDVPYTVVLAGGVRRFCRRGRPHCWQMQVVVRVVRVAIFALVGGGGGSEVS